MLQPVMGTIQSVFWTGRLAAAALLVMAGGCASPSSASPRPSTSQQAVSQRFAVACDHELASQAGAEMLRLGGNAVDAAVAAAFCLSVVRPDSCGIGGGGFMLIHRPPNHPRGPATIAINYRETCPAGVGPDHFEKLSDPLASRFGGHAVAVPGTVAGLLAALEQHGTLDRWTVLEPAIRAAEDGWPADDHHVKMAAELRRTLRDSAPHLTEAAAYLWRELCLDGRVKIGDRLRNPDQARALRLIAEFGREAFADGPIGRAIIDVVARHGGVMTADDLAGPAVHVMSPLRGRFMGYDVLTMPPPSSGGIAMQQVLAMAQRRGRDLRQAGHNSPASAHLLAEMFKHAFADRARWPADPLLVDVPVEQLLDAAALARLARSIDPSRTHTPESYGTAEPPPDDSGTSHISVIDADGMAVACTETINLSWGSLLCVPGFGFALNNQMDDFTTRPGEANAFGLRQSDRNLPAPGKRPLSSMSPTIVLKDGRAVLVAGGSGGPRIITGTTQCVLNSLLWEMSAADAVNAPRLHHQWMPDVLELEDRWPERARSEAKAALETIGHRVGRRDIVGCVQLIRITDRGIEAASDPRKGGRPAGE